MKLEIIFRSTRSFTIELKNNDIYTTKPYSVYLNDKLVIENNDKNVFSLFNLEQDTKYKLEVVQGNDKASIDVTTLKESVTLNVKKFGAKGDGVSLDTNFIQATILACPDGGRVYFPKGNYYTGPLFLRSNITIEIAKMLH